MVDRQVKFVASLFYRFAFQVPLVIMLYSYPSLSCFFFFFSFFSLLSIYMNFIETKGDILSKADNSITRGNIEASIANSK
jgi:hypothetical protein